MQLIVVSPVVWAVASSNLHEDIKAADASLPMPPAC